MKIKRGYDDRDWNDCDPTYLGVFGKQTDSGKDFALFKTNNAYGFQGEAHLPFTIPAGQNPVDVMISAGSAFVAAGNAQVQAKFSKAPGDFEGAQIVTNGAPAAGFRVGNVPGKSHDKYTEGHPGETWFLNVRAVGGGAFWVTENCTNH